MCGGLVRSLNGCSRECDRVFASVDAGLFHPTHCSSFLSKPLLRPTIEFGIAPRSPSASG
jgi:hypothetical protein